MAFTVNIAVSFSLCHHMFTKHLLCAWSYAGPGEKDPGPILKLLFGCWGSR